MLTWSWDGSFDNGAADLWRARCSGKGFVGYALLPKGEFPQEVTAKTIAEAVTVYHRRQQEGQAQCVGNE